MQRLLRAIPALLLLILAACSPAATTAPVAPALDRGDPAAVNAAWVEALRANDRDAALALYDAGSEQANTYNVGNYLDSLAQRIYPQPDDTPSTGTFDRVEVVGMQEIGAARRAYSQWFFSKKNLCYFADLTQINGDWTITDWTKSDESDCAQ